MKLESKATSFQPLKKSKTARIDIIFICLKSKPLRRWQKDLDLWTGQYFVTCNQYANTWDKHLEYFRLFLRHVHFTLYLLPHLIFLVGFRLLNEHRQIVTNSFQNGRSSDC